MYNQVIVVNYIKEKCAEKGITLRQLAAETGISETQIYKVTENQANFRLDNVARILVALDCDFNDIFKIVTR